MSNLFGLFFWDVIFMDVPDVFHSAYQTHPLDLYSTLFYSNRQSAIDLRLEEIKTASVEVCFSSHISVSKNSYNQFQAYINSY